MEKLGATMDRTTKGNYHQSNPHPLLRWTQDQQLSGQASRERAQKPQGRGKNASMQSMRRVHQLVVLISLKMPLMKYSEIK